MQLRAFEKPVHGLRNGNILLVLGVFPSFHSKIGGGVQNSGILAWRGLQGSRECKCQGFWYGEAANDTEDFQAGSKLEALWLAARRQWPAGVVLVWHVNLLKLLPAFRTGIAKTVVFLHGVEAWTRMGWLTRRVLRGVDLFLCNSEYTWGRFTAAHPECRNMSYKCVPLGIGYAPHEGPPAASPKRAAVMIGRIVSGEDYKGHREVIDAWPIVQESVPDAEVVILGDGDLRHELEIIVQQRGLERHIRFAGFVSEQEKERLIGESRCLVLPSRAEGFGLVYLEAMRLGRPCVVSTVDAGREVVNPPEAGLAADPASTHDLARTIIRLLEPGDETEAWRTRAFHRYSSRYTAEHFQQRLIDALLAV